MLKGIVLKPNMVVPGFKSSKKATSEEIAKKTLDCLKKNVPSNVPGIAFLSGGQSEQEATQIETRARLIFEIVAEDAEMLGLVINEDQSISQT